MNRKAKRKKMFLFPWLLFMMYKVSLKVFWKRKRNEKQTFGDFLSLLLFHFKNTSGNLVHWGPCTQQTLGAAGHWIGKSAWHVCIGQPLLEKVYSLAKLSSSIVLPIWALIVVLSFDEIWCDDHKCILSSNLFILLKCLYSACLISMNLATKRTAKAERMHSFTPSKMWVNTWTWNSSYLK